MGIGLSRALGQAWRVPDVGYTQAQLDAAHTAVWDRAGGSVPELVVVGGDRAAGLGLVSSIVDVLVVSADKPGVHVHDQDGHRVRMHDIPVERAAELLALGTGPSPGPADASVTSADLRILLDLVTGHRLLADADWSRLLDAVSPDRIRQLLITRTARAAATCAADVFDALLAGDLFTALTMSSGTLLAGCEALLAAVGDLGVGVKFLFRRLARPGPSAAWCGYLWQLLNWSFPAGTVPQASTVRLVAETRLLVANLLLSWCALEGWDAPLTDLPGPPLDVFAGGPVRGPRRSPYFMPVRCADEWRLIGPGEAHTVTSAPVLRLWRGLDGAGPGEATGLGWDEVERIMATLRAHGAVEVSDLPSNRVARR